MNRLVRLLLTKALEEAEIIFRESCKDYGDYSSEAIFKKTLESAEALNTLKEMLKGEK